MAMEINNKNIMKINNTNSTTPYNDRAYIQNGGRKCEMATFRGENRTKVNADING